MVFETRVAQDPAAGGPFRFVHIIEDHHPVWCRHGQHHGEASDPHFHHAKIVQYQVAPGGEPLELLPRLQAVGAEAPFG